MGDSSVEALLDRGATALGTASEGSWFDELDRRQSEVSAAVDRVLASGDSADAARLGGRLWEYWTRRAEDGKARLEQVLEASGGAPPSEASALVHYAAGLLAFRQGDNERSRTLNLRALELARAAVSPIGECRALIGLSRAAFRDHDWDGGAEYAAEAGTIAAASGDTLGTVQALHMKAEIRRAAGDYEAARPLYDQLLVIDRAEGDQRSISMELYNRGSVLLQLGLLDDAERDLRESIAVAVDHGIVDQFPYCLLGLGGLAARRADAVTAGRLLGAVEAHLASEGIVLDPAEQVELDSHLAAGASADAAGFTAARAAGHDLDAVSLAKAIRGG